MKSKVRLSSKNVLQKLTNGLEFCYFRCEKCLRIWSLWMRFLKFFVFWQLRSSLSKEGFIFVTSDRTRHQHMNIADALEKLREMIRSCEPVQVAELPPETVELHRKRAEKAARERLRQKRDRSSTKSSRGAADF